jgi:hypothetical protein
VHAGIDSAERGKPRLPSSRFSTIQARRTVLAPTVLIEREPRKIMAVASD